MKKRKWRKKAISKRRTHNFSINEPVFVVHPESVLPFHAFSRLCATCVVKRGKDIQKTNEKDKRLFRAIFILVHDFSKEGFYRSLVASGFSSAVGTRNFFVCPDRFSAASGRLADLHRERKQNFSPHRLITIHAEEEFSYLHQFRIDQTPFWISKKNSKKKDFSNNFEDTLLEIVSNHLMTQNFRAISFDQWSEWSENDGDFFLPNFPTAKTLFSHPSFQFTFSLINFKKFFKERDKRHVFLVGLSYLEKTKVFSPFLRRVVSKLNRFYFWTKKSFKSYREKRTWTARCFFHQSRVSWKWFFTLIFLFLDWDLVPNIRWRWSFKSTTQPLMVSGSTTASATLSFGTSMAFRSRRSLVRVIVPVRASISVWRPSAERTFSAFMSSFDAFWPFFFTKSCKFSNFSKRSSSWRSFSR